MRKFLQQLLFISILVSVGLRGLFSPIACWASGVPQTISRGNEKVQLPFAVKIYVSKKGDNIKKIAGLYNISVKALQSMNSGYRFRADGLIPQSGLLLLVPQKPLSKKISQSFDKDVAAQKYDNIFAKAVQFLQSSSSVQDVAYKTAQDFAQSISNNINAWANQYGTARISFGVNHKFGLLSEIDFLLPLFDVENKLFFGQISANQKKEGTALNLGLGGRYFGASYMLGLNGFADYNFYDKSFRLGSGFEFWLNYLKLSANGYLGLGSAQASALENYQAKAASGFDVKGEFYIPQLPSLGLSAAFEKYFGLVTLNEVKGYDDLRQDPHSFTLGISYTPVPLLKLSLDQKLVGSHKKTDISSLTRLSMQVNYRLGVPLGEQLNRHNVSAIRQVSNSRYDFVERNNNIILEYKERIKLRLYPEISGEEGDSKALFSVADNLPKDTILKWNGDKSLILSSACNDVENLSSCTVTLPKYQNNSNNVYILNFSVLQDGKEKFSQKTKLSVTKKQDLPLVMVDFVDKNPQLLLGQAGDFDILIKNRITNQPIKKSNLLVAALIKESEKPSINDDTIFGKDLLDISPIAGKDGAYRIHVPALKDAGVYALYVGLRETNSVIGTAKLVVKDPAQNLQDLEVKSTVEGKDFSIHNKQGITLTLQVKDKKTGKLLHHLGKRLKFIYDTKMAKALSGLVEKEDGRYEQNFVGILAEKVTFTPVFVTTSGKDIPLSEAVKIIEFTDYQKVDSMEIKAEPKEIWQGKETYAGMAHSMHISIKAKKAGGTAANLGSELDVAILNEAGKEVAILTAHKKDGIYEADLDANLLPVLAQRSQPYVYKILPLIDPQYCSKPVPVPFKVRAALPDMNALQIEAKAENVNVELNGKTCIFLTVKDKNTGLSYDLPKEVFSLSLEKEDGKAHLSQPLLVGTGAYEVEFLAGDIIKNYKIHISYRNQFVKDLPIEVCLDGLSNQDVHFGSDKTVSYMTSDEGILLTLVINNKKFLKNNWRERVGFAITNVKNEPIAYTVLAEKNEDTAGVFRKAIKLKEAGDFIATPYIYKADNKKYYYHDKALRLSFKNYVFVSEKVEVSEKAIASADAHTSYKTIAHVKFLPTAEDRVHVVDLTKIAYAIYDEAGKKLFTLKSDPYKNYAVLDVKAFGKLPYRPGAYVYKIVPEYEKAVFSPDTYVKIEVYAPVPKASDVNMTVSSEKSIYFTDEDIVLHINLTQPVFNSKLLLDDTRSLKDIIQFCDYNNEKVILPKKLSVLSSGTIEAIINVSGDARNLPILVSYLGERKASCSLKIAISPDRMQVKFNIMGPRYVCSYDQEVPVNVRTTDKRNGQSVHFFVDALKVSLEASSGEHERNDALLVPEGHDKGVASQAKFDLYTGYSHKTYKINVFYYGRKLSELEVDVRPPTEVDIDRYKFRLFLEKGTNSLVELKDDRAVTVEGAKTYNVILQVHNRKYGLLESELQSGSNAGGHAAPMELKLVGGQDCAGIELIDNVSYLDHGNYKATIRVGSKSACLGHIRVAISYKNYFLYLGTLKVH